MANPTPQSADRRAAPAVAALSATAPPYDAVDEGTLEQTQLELIPSTLPGGSLARQVILLALPMLGEQLGNFAVGMVDMFLAGFLSKEATGAVGTAAYVGWFAGLTMMLIGTGAAALISRSLGGGDARTANRTANQALVMMVILGVLTSLGTWLLAPAFATLLAPTAEARSLFVLFLRIDAFGYLGYAVFSIISTSLRAAGDTRTPMAIMLVVNVVNVLLSSSLVFGWLGPSLGVAGIASGTLTARWVGGLAALVVLLRGRRELQIRHADLRPDFAVIWRVLRIGIPGAAEAALMAAAQFCFIKIIAETADGPLGAANYAAHMIAVRMEAITYLPAMAWMTAAATMVGQYLGARQPAKAARATHLAALQGGLLTTGVAVCFFLFARGIFTLLSNDPQVREVGSAGFRILAFFQPFLCLGIIYNGALRGAGDTRYTMLVSLVCGFLIRVPVAYLFGIVLHGGLIGAWIGMWSDNVLRLTLALARYLHGGWQRVRV